MLKCTVALGFGTIGLAAAGATAHADTITIQKGDTVWGYSQRYHVTMGDIVKANNLKNPNLIIAGKAPVLQARRPRPVQRRRAPLLAPLVLTQRQARV